MKKILTLFERTFENNRARDITEKVTPGMEWVLDGEGIATLKIDGSCCAIIDGKFYRRYDAKKGKKPPVNAIPCCEPDLLTGHWPHWVPVDVADKGDKWFLAAYQNSGAGQLDDGTFEAIGSHFQNNPYGLSEDILERHGIKKITDAPRTFDGLRDYLSNHNIEGIVFWKDGEPQCKIKRSDFGFKWPEKGYEN